MTTRTVAAMFASRQEAEKAAQDLANTLAIDRSRVRVSPEAGAADTDYDQSQPYRETGFFASLKNLFLPEEDRYAFAEGLRRGHFLVSVQVDESHLTRATETLERNSALDIDAEEASWRQTGWRGYDIVTHGMARSAAGTMQTGATQAGTAASSGIADRAAAAAARPGVAANREEVIPLAEEQLVIGKRVVERGQVRIRTYVVERPVEEQVRLRDETVQVERRAVDRPVAEGDREAFSERVVEMTETDEEAVVRKEARIVEEVAVHKTAEERTETVRDTVRRTEVEVDNGTGRMPAGAMPLGAGAGHGAHASMRGESSDNPDGSPGNPPGTMLSRGTDQVLGTNVSGAHPENEQRGGMISDNPDGTPGNPPGTLASRAADRTLGTNMSGAHPENERRGGIASDNPDGTPGNPPGTMLSRGADQVLGTNMSGAYPENEQSGGMTSDNPDGTPGNPPGTMASRAVDKTLGTNTSGANPGSRRK